MWNQRHSVRWCWVRCGPSFYMLYWVCFVLHRANLTPCQDRCVPTCFCLGSSGASFHLSNLLWLKQILLFVLWQYLEGKNPGVVVALETLIDSTLLLRCIRIWIEWKKTIENYTETMLHKWQSFLFIIYMYNTTGLSVFTDHYFKYFHKQRRQQEQKLVNYPAVYWSEAKGRNEPLL